MKTKLGWESFHDNINRLAVLFFTAIFMLCHAGQGDSSRRLTLKPASKSQWIWSHFDLHFSMDRQGPMQNAFFRYSFNLDKTVQTAELFLGVRLPGSRVFVNGKQVAIAPLQQPRKQLMADRYWLQKELHDGRNVLAIEVVNTCEDKREQKSCGLIFLCKLAFEDGTVQYLHSGAAVKAVTDTPPADWIQPEFDDSAWPEAMEMGDAATERWRQMGDTMRFFATDEERQAFQEELKRDAILEPSIAATIAKEPEPQVCIDWKNGLPIIRNHAEEILPIRRIGLHFNSPYDGYDFICNSYGIGLDLLEIRLSRSYWQGEGKYDFSEFALLASRVLRCNPQARLMVGLSFEHLREWCRKHPDEVINYATGDIIPNSDDMLGRPLEPSPASRLFRAETDRIIQAFGKYIQSQPWSKRVVGVAMHYGVYSEWQWYGSNKNMPDTGKAMTTAFREWLTRKYGSDSALQKAWHNPAATIQDALPPTSEQRWGKHQFLRDPATEQAVMDYYDCMQDELADLMIALGTSMKRNLPGRICGCYYSYQNMPRPPEGMKSREERILASGAIDWFMAPNDYNPESRSPGGTGLTRVRNSIIRRFNKLGIFEADIRTHIAENSEKLLRLKNLDETVACLRRDFCCTIFDRGGIQLHQFGGNGPFRSGPDWFNDSGIIEELARNIAVQKKVREITGMDWHQDIVVVSDFNQFVHHGYPVQDFLMNYTLVWWPMYALYNTGYCFDYVDIKDYFLDKRPHKIVIFLHPFSFTDEQRQELARRMRGSSTTVIWTYAPGFVTEDGFSETAMAELTGMRMKADFRKLPLKLDREAGKTSWNVWNPYQKIVHEETPRFSCIDQSVKVKGRWSDDGGIAFAEKQMDGWRSVFIGIPLSQASYWTELLKEYGGWQYVEPGVIVRCNSKLMMVHVGKGGNYRVSLPRKAVKASDMFTGETVGQNCDSFTLSSRTCHTWLLRLD